MIEGKKTSGQSIISFTVQLKKEASLASCKKLKQIAVDRLEWRICSVIQLTDRTPEVKRIRRHCNYYYFVFKYSLTDSYNLSKTVFPIAFLNNEYLLVFLSYLSSIILKKLILALLVWMTSIPSFET